MSVSAVSGSEGVCCAAVMQFVVVGNSCMEHTTTCGYMPGHSYSSHSQASSQIQSYVTRYRQQLS